MTQRHSLLPSVAGFIALAALAVAAIYYGAVPWALHRSVDAVFWLFGYR